MLEDLLDYAKYLAIGKFNEYIELELIWQNGKWYARLEHPFLVTENYSPIEAVKELIEKIKNV